MKEHALLLGKDRSLIGILTEKDASDLTGKNNSTGFLLLNAGLIHHVGPNRIYVKIARLLAAIGFVVVRFDFSGIGDSGPRRDKMPAIETVVDEAAQVMDYLERVKGVKRFSCVGLCAGAAAASHIASSDHRVKMLILINPMLPETDQVSWMRGSGYYLNHAIFKLNSWRKVFFFKSSYRDIWQAVRMAIKRKFQAKMLENEEIPSVSTAVRSLFRSLREREVRVLIVYSEGDIGDAYFQGIIGDEYRTMQESGLLKIEILKGSDHVVTPLRCQEKLLVLISNWLTGRP